MALLLICQTLATQIELKKKIDLFANNSFGYEKSGFCVDKNDKDVNSGVIKLMGGDFKDNAKKLKCLQLCAAHSGFTGCETNYDSSHRGCYVHTSKAIAQGSNAKNFSCWLKAVEIPTISLPANKWFNLIGPDGFCVEAPSSNGKRLTQSTCSSDSNLQWQFIAFNGGYVIKNNNNFVIDNSGSLPASRKKNGNKIQGWKQLNGKNQIWVPEMVNANTFVIKNPESNKCLDATGKHSNGSLYQIWTCKSNKNQLFKLGTPQAAHTLFGDENSGYCVDKDDRDVNSGSKTLMTGEFLDKAKKLECLQLCAEHSGFTGCETSGKGCFVHTSKAIAHGNYAKRTSCWFKQSEREKEREIEGEKEREREKKREIERVRNHPSFGIEDWGYCVDKDNKDVNSGAKTLMTGEFLDKAKKLECLQLCAAHSGFTGCETSRKGCFVHTSKAIAHGNYKKKHSCWLKKSDSEIEREREEREREREEEKETERERVRDEQKKLINYTPFQTKESNAVQEKESVAINTCRENGIFGLNGKCYGGDNAKKWLANLDMPGDNEFIQDIWDDFIAPLIKILPTNMVPSGCLGDFPTNTLLSDKASKASTCASFPLPKDNKMSAIGFSLINVPCVDLVNVKLCAIFDKCGTFGVSLSGGISACFTSLSSGIGAILSPAQKSVKYIQFGYSPNRMWESKLTLLDPDNNMAEKIINLKSHFYTGTQFAIPPIGIQFNGEDITSTFALKIEGKAFIDLGSKNDFTPTNLKALIKDKNIKADKKILTFLGAAREYSIMAKGSLELNLGKITKNVLPNVKLADLNELNLLINLGAGPDGDRGSSGMPPGFHIFIRPPKMDILEDFLEKILKTITKALKIGFFPVPRLPNLKNIEMGFSIGEKISFKFGIDKAFSMSCTIKTKGGFSVSCKLGLDFLTIFKDIGKWIGKMGKKLFDVTGIPFMEIGSAVGDFAGDIAVGAVKIFEGLKDTAKKLYEDAKKTVNFLHDKTKQAIGDIVKINEKAIKFASKAAEDCVKALKDIGGKFDKVGNQIKDKIGDIAGDIKDKVFGWIFLEVDAKVGTSLSKLKREKSQLEQDAKDNENLREYEMNKREAEKYKLIGENEDLKKEEIKAAEIEIEKCEDDENKGKEYRSRKKLAYALAKQHLKDIRK